MKNKEKYEGLVLSFACDKNNSFGVDKKTGEMKICSELHCTECLFYRKIETCRASRRKWLEQEYTEKPVISKRDRAFLEYLDKKFEYIARDNISWLYVYSRKPIKNEKCWARNGCKCFGFDDRIDVDFPMVKWEDDEPWLIEDLKKLEVVENYE